MSGTSNQADNNRDAPMPFRLSSVSLLAAAAVLAASVASADGMQLHLFPDADVTGARCLDGTPSGCVLLPRRCQRTVWPTAVACGPPLCF